MVSTISRVGFDATSRCGVPPFLIKWGQLSSIESLVWLREKAVLAYLLPMFFVLHFDQAHQTTIIQ